VPNHPHLHLETDMRVYLAALALLSVATAPAASAAEQETVAATQRDLKVTGPREGLERFIALQSSHNPPLATSAVTPLDNGRATAVVTLSAGSSGQELLRTTREALAAGLSYEYADAGPIRIRRR
jgi:hypothetical protein